MKSSFIKYFRNPKSISMFFMSLICFSTNPLKAQELYLEEMKIDSSTKFEEKNSSLPTDPFQIVEMIRRANSLNDATLPSDAIDNALKSFNMIDKKEKL